MLQQSAETPSPTLDSVEGDEPWHGTEGGYSYRGCRGPRCREANRLKRNRQRRQRGADAKPDGEHWHGTYNGYMNHGCRCEPCKGAVARYRKKKRVQQAKVEDAFQRAQLSAYAMGGERKAGALAAISFLYEALSSPG